MKNAQKLLVVLTFLILGFGFLPLLAQPLPYKDLDWLSYESVTYYNRDAYEPDDARRDAKECAVQGPIQFHNFHVRGDPDWVWFQVQANSTYAIETIARPLGSLADTVLELYNSGGQQIAIDDDGGAMTDARIFFRATYTGIYYGRVTEWANRYGDAYWYRLRVVERQPYYLPIVTRGYS